MTRADLAASDGAECHRNHHPTMTQKIQEGPTCSRRRAHAARPARGGRGAVTDVVPGSTARSTTAPATIAAWSESAGRAPGLRVAGHTAKPPLVRALRW